MFNKAYASTCGMQSLGCVVFNDSLASRRSDPYKLPLDDPEVHIIFS